LIFMWNYKRPTQSFWKKRDVTSPTFKRRPNKRKRRSHGRRQYTIRKLQFLAFLSWLNVYHKYFLIFGSGSGEELLATDNSIISISISISRIQIHKLYVYHIYSTVVKVIGWTTAP